MSFVLLGTVIYFYQYTVFDLYSYFFVNNCICNFFLFLLCLNQFLL